MNFLIIHNQYRDKGGEESVVAFQEELLRDKGHKVILYTRQYSEANSWLFGKAWSTFTSVYNPKSKRDIKKILQQEKIDVAIIHNVFSIISPAIFSVLRSHGVKIWQVVHNYRLFCPIGIFFHNGKICEDCLGKHREWNCMKNRCTENRLSDVTFSWKFSTIRHLNYYKNVDLFFALSHFQIDKLASLGIDKNKLRYLPNTYKPLDNPPEFVLENKKYVGFVGRLTKEKGFFDFVDLAKKMPQYEFRVAGQITPEVESLSLPENLKFEGFLDKEKMAEFYSKCKVVLFLSTWYEGFPMVLVEALYYHTPLIVNDLSVMGEVVESSYNGFKVKIGEHSQEQIQQYITLLFENKAMYERITYNCRQCFDENYSIDKYYSRLLQERI